MSIILAIFTGACISVMIFLNGSLESYIGSIPTLLFIHLSASIVTLSSFIKKMTPKKREPKSRLYLLAGLLGIFIVTISNKVFLKGGVLLTLSGTLTGQVLIAAILELYSNLKKNKLYINRLISLVFIIPGTIIIGIKSDMTIWWIMLSWLPGMLIFCQAYMNSQNILAIGFRKTLITHFSLALVPILPMIYFTPFNNVINDILSGKVPIVFLVGGGSIAILVIALGSYLLLKLKPITYVLLLYSGQITSALIIDYILGNHLSIYKLIALIMVICGLLLSEFKYKNTGCSPD